MGYDIYFTTTKGIKFILSSPCMIFVQCSLVCRGINSVCYKLGRENINFLFKCGCLNL